ncbi:glycosyltransferase [Candidatus Pelagibacter sp.]|nr:glycosyltransferase [Candidatus Pelagibacter sp.]
MNSPLISIVIPTYNHAKFIGKALKSVLDQTYKNWEAIVIDNHSTDQTKQILDNYTDPRIKYFKINNNGIIAKSRNLGIKKATGEWIAFLDSDDWWTEDKLEICFNNIINNIDFIYHDLEIINNQSNSFFKGKKYKGRALNKPILLDLLIGGIAEGNAIGNSSVIVRKNLLIKIGGISENINLVASEDYNTWLRIAQITDKFKYLKKRLGYYLIHNASAQKRDLSIPHKESVIEFMTLFNSEQKLKFEVKLKYMSANYNLSNNEYFKAKKDFIFVFKKGDINYKIRSLLKIIIMIIK